MHTTQGDQPEDEPRVREPWTGRRPQGEAPPPRAEAQPRYAQEPPGPPPDFDEGFGPPPPPPPPPRSRVDFSPFFVLLDALRRAVPGDLQNQFTSLVREALLTLRSLIDWYLDRLDRPAREPRVEDIPID